MPFGLTIGTERAFALQESIENELLQRGFSAEPDPVMAEYITIMIINNKSAAQITSELEDLIGADFDDSFTEWLFAEAAKSAPSDAPPVTLPSENAVSDIVEPQEPPQPIPISETLNRRPQQPTRNGYQHSLPPHKRPAPGRSPSPSHPSKIRRTEIPTGPRAMTRHSDNMPPKSLSERIGSRVNDMHQDDIQARINSITNGDPGMGMMQGVYPNGLDMGAMNMGNPMVMQELMMGQMALMAQMASNMGIIPSQFPAAGFGVPGNMMPQDMAMFPGPQVGPNGFQHNGRGRGSGRGRSMGRGRGGNSSSGPIHKPVESIESASSMAPASKPVAPPAPAASPVVAPTPVPATVLTTPVAAPVETPQRIPYAVPIRPQSPTLCKFGPKCTNAHCRYSHPSPVATAESGIVLSNDPCEQGKDCKDQDCIKAHVSPAVLHALADAPVLAPASPTVLPCKFGDACTRPGCSFYHARPRKLSAAPAASPSRYVAPCRFGAACTRTTCPYQHPEGRVLPTSFHRGLSASSPMVTVPTPETGSMGASPHRSMTFNKVGSGVEERLAKQLKEIEGQKKEIQQKQEAEKAARDALKADVAMTPQAAASAAS
ncbi:hypothetical protein FISHEDRAFT_71871 [Fistulina hepatica ATCC 64428]|uniref:Nab2 type CCCH zinc finger 4 domain-containing protein n=1 Tax=Fistulina hepatica ATCC 64428 TaxID=1128425 RepID=A0A0D7AHF5_9AGAR|nr:hypothetical protein FISHEDRAFT_71871 [Fistulina hepatica ATCC 64428]